jgi:hypothetical protein
MSIHQLITPRMAFVLGRFGDQFSALCRIGLSLSLNGRVLHIPESDTAWDGFNFTWDTVVNDDGIYMTWHCGYGSSGYLNFSKDKDGVMCMRVFHRTCGGHFGEIRCTSASDLVDVRVDDNASERFWADSDMLISDYMVLRREALVGRGTAYQIWPE